MLLLPGTPGFAHFHFGFAKDSGFGVITVNRPGYGNVPLTNDNKTAEQQADLCMALMDHLGIEKFPLMVASGGGCIGLRMAIQYPERVQCLIMQCATTGDYPHPDIDTVNSAGARWGMTSPLVARMMTYWMTSDFASAMKEDIMTSNKVKPNCISADEAQKLAEAFAADPYNKELIDNM